MPPSGRASGWLRASPARPLRHAGVAAASCRAALSLPPHPPARSAFPHARVSLRRAMPLRRSRAAGPWGRLPLPLFLVALAACAARASEITFELPDNAKQCFYEEIAQGTKCTLEFQVGGQTHGGSAALGLGASPAELGPGPRRPATGGRRACAGGGAFVRLLRASGPLRADAEVPPGRRKRCVVSWALRGAARGDEFSAELTSGL